MLVAFNGKEYHSKGITGLLGSALMTPGWFLMALSMLIMLPGMWIIRLGGKRVK